MLGDETRSRRRGERVGEERDCERFNSEMDVHRHRPVTRYLYLIVIAGEGDARLEGADEFQECRADFVKD